VAHEEGNLNDLRAILGNDVAIKTYREGKLPFPDGTIIARLAWNYVPSEENNKVFGRSQSFVPGPLRIGIFSLWSRTQKSTPRRAAGDSLNLIRTANPPTRRSTKPAFLATSLSKLGTLSSPVTHLRRLTRGRPELSLCHLTVWLHEENRRTSRHLVVLLDVHLLLCAG